MQARYYVTAISVLVAGGFPCLAEPMAGDGGVGATSYRTLPFTSNVYKGCWGCSSGLEPANLFWQWNPDNQFNNAAVMAQVRAGSAAIEAMGLIPSTGIQRWEDTAEVSLPASEFGTEPGWMLFDRMVGSGTQANPNPFTSQGDYVAWASFIQSHPQYWDLAYDGGTMPNQSDYFRSWGGQWFHISPLTPLDQADCPPDMPNGCTWGDTWSYMFSTTSALSGGYGVQLSDFTDSQPSYPDYLHDFNPRIVAAFAAQYGYGSQLAGLGTVDAATWINTNAYNNWNDYLSQGYGRYYNAMATRVGAATAREALVEDQCSSTPAYRRLGGTDQRIIATQMNPDQYVCTWDDQVTQTGRSGPVAAPPMGELSGFIIAAARAPQMRNAANLEADDSAYWAAIAQFYPTLSATDQQEVGYKLLKREWLWASFASVATREGHVRRAMAMMSRDYWDAGSLAALDPLTSVIQGIHPVAPFGAALYYSVPVERTVEALEQQNVQGYNPTYLSYSDLQGLIDGGGNFGYYVSDIALPSIRAAAGNAPSAWVVPLYLGQDYLAPSELAALQAVAPVVNTPAQLAALPDQPFVLSAGLSGFGFIDQKGRLIAVISNPSTQPTAGSLTGTLSIAGFGTSSLFKVADLLAGGKPQKVTGANGTLTLPIALTRWDTQVLAITGE